MATRERRQRNHKIAVTSAAATTPRRKVPWLLAAMSGGFAVALAGWLLVTGACVVGWLGATDVGFGAAIRFGTELWLLANGGAIVAGGVQLSVVPLGLTLALVVLATGAAGWVIQQLPFEPGEQQMAKIWRAIGVFTLTYTLTVGLALFLTSASELVWRTVVCSMLIAGGSGLWAAVSAKEFDPLKHWPVWLKAVPKAVLAAVLVVVFGGALVFVAALLQNKDAIIALHNSLDPGAAGGVLLLLVQLAYLPNFIGWCSSWSLGAGLAVGVDTVVAPTQTQVGLMPAVPVFGAISENGPGSWSALSWLLVGVVAGIVAAVIIVLARPRARADETALVGGLSGVLAGVLITFVLALTNGAFGVARLTQIGARISDLIVLAPTLLGISGLVAGLVIGLLRRTPTEPEDDDDVENEDTAVNPRLDEATQPYRLP